MTMHFRDLADTAAADGLISAAEILALRRECWRDGVIGPEEAEAIFRVNDRIHLQSAEWTDFFVEALGEFIVHAADPRGYVSDARAEWLLERLGHDGRLETMAELELLVRVLEKATNVPERLKACALAAIEEAVAHGTGPTRDGGALQPGRVTEAETWLLRRAIFAQAGDGPARVSKAEADMLFRLKDAALDGENAPDWQRLFVQGVGNYLTAYAGYAPLSRERAGELETFMADTTSGVGGFMARMARSDVEGGFAQLWTRSEARDHAALVARDAEVTTDENAWLQGRIDANNQLDAFDKALLAFLAEEGVRP